ERRRVGGAEARRDPAALAETVARGLAAGKVERARARVRQLDADDHLLAARIGHAEEDEDLLADLGDVLAPGLVLPRFGQRERVREQVGGETLQGAGHVGNLA